MARQSYARFAHEYTYLWTINTHGSIPCKSLVDLAHYGEHGRMELSMGWCEHIPVIQCQPYIWSIPLAFNAQLVCIAEP